MNLNCPSCGSQETQKLSLVMERGGLVEKGAKLGAAYVYNIWIPVASLFFGVAFGVVFAMWNGYLGLAVFAGILYAGFAARKWMKGKTKSKFSDLPAPMKQNGFQCNRCEHMFIPTAAGLDQLASAS
jgi:hypothetical protein